MEYHLEVEEQVSGLCLPIFGPNARLNGLTRAENGHQVDNMAVEIIKTRSENVPTFYDFLSTEAPSDHESPSPDRSMTLDEEDEGVCLDLSLWITTRSTFHEALVERTSSNASANEATNINALAKVQPLHKEFINELHVLDSLKKEAGGAIEEVVEQSLDAEVKHGFQPIAAGNFSETLSTPYDCILSKELESPSSATADSNSVDNNGFLESVVLEKSDTVANELVPSGTETINDVDEVDARFGKLRCFNFFRCMPFLSILLEWKKRRGN